MFIKSVVSTVAAIAVSICAAVSAYAGTTVPSSLAVYHDGSEGWYDIIMSPASDRRESDYRAQSVLSREFKSVSSMAVGGMSAWHKADGFVGTLNLTQWDSMCKIEQTCNSWLQAHMPVIVPQGTPVGQVTDICARKVADMMTYDSSLVEDPAYQCALPCFQSGKGVCATYAYAFNSMVSYVPYNPQTGLVDYSASAPAHLETAFVRSELRKHAWSAVSYADGWHFFDVCWFDVYQLPSYLDHTGSLWSDGSHDAYVVISAAR